MKNLKLEQSNNYKVNFFSKIIPSKYIRYSLWILLSLFISPILIIILEPSFVKDAISMDVIIWTLSICLVIYSIMIGFIFVFYKNPFMQEMKDKLGYTEI